MYGLQYDYSVATFSPDGKVFQTEYAQKAVDNSSYALTSVYDACAANSGVSRPEYVQDSYRLAVQRRRHFGVIATLTLC